MNIVERLVAEHIVENPFHASGMLWYNNFVTVSQEIFYSEIKHRPSAALLYCDKFGMQIGGVLFTGAQA